MFYHTCFSVEDVGNPLDLPKVQSKCRLHPHAGAATIGFAPLGLLPHLPLGLLMELFPQELLPVALPSRVLLSQVWKPPVFYHHRLRVGHAGLRNADSVTITGDYGPWRHPEVINSRLS